MSISNDILKILGPIAFADWDKSLENGDLIGTLFDDISLRFLNLTGDASPHIDWLGYLRIHYILVGVWTQEQGWIFRMKEEAYANFCSRAWIDEGVSPYPPRK